MMITLQKKLRLKIIELAAKTNSAHSHIGSCLSCIDILIQTWVYEMKATDKFILSKGHASLALYVMLNYLKKISNADLATYFAEGTEFGIHTPSTRPDLIPLATGSLGHGLSFAAGMAKGYHMQNKKKPRRVFCLMSDGECNEGAVWEAALFASYHKLKNLVVLIDKNKWQALGKTSEVLGDATSAAKWRAFGFNVFLCNGHSLVELDKTFAKARKSTVEKPVVIICRTVRAKGVKFLENKLESNYTPLDAEGFKRAVAEIKKM